MKRILFLSMMLGFVALLAGLWAAPASADIVNGGFESGLTGWTSSGDVSQTNAGLDPRTNNALSMVGIGSHSARVGDENAWGYVRPQYSSISQTWTVGNTFKDLYFYWSAVGLVPTNDYPHTTGQTPWFRVNLYDVTKDLTLLNQAYFTGNIGDITTGWVEGATHTSGLGQDDAGIWYYRPWEQFHFDVSPYIGDDLRVTLETRDCELDGHASYAYLDGFGTTPPVTGVPEPATMLLLGSGLIGLAGLARRRFHKK